VYIFVFKVGAVIYLASLPVLGERVLPLWIVGLLVGAASFVQLMGDVPAGFLLDRFGYVRLLRLACLCLALGGFLLWIFGFSLWIFLVLIVISGIGWLFFSPGVDAYVVTSAPSEQVGRAMGLRRVMSSLGAVAGTACFTLLLPFSPRMIGLVIGSILLLALVIAFRVKKERTTRHSHIKLEAKHYYIRRTFLIDIWNSLNKLRPASGLLAFSRFAAGTFYSSMWFVFPLLLKTLADQGPLEYGLGIFDAGTIICGGIAGKLADTKNKTFTILAGLIIFASFSMILGFHLSIWFLLFGFLAALGDELSAVSLWAWLSDLHRDHAHEGVIAGAVNFFEDLGWVVGPILAGILYDRIGPSWTILCAASFIFLNCVLSCLVLRKKVSSIIRHSFETPAVRPNFYAHRD
jgi:MFS family permease